jgi:hypothetical protein
MKKFFKKRKGFGLHMTTKEGSRGNYLFIKTPTGAYHAFLEMAAKDAARDCGARKKGNARQLCKEICGF